MLRIWTFDLTLEIKPHTYHIYMPTGLTISKIYFAHVCKYQIYFGYKIIRVFGFCFVPYFLFITGPKMRGARANNALVCHLVVRWLSRSSVLYWDRNELLLLCWCQQRLKDGNLKMICEVQYLIFFANRSMHTFCSIQIQQQQVMRLSDCTVN